ncbi:glycoside hydrolase family 43 protein [Candidatus Sumerlaeota bacterium]|nr:glycoside hydrolase family 43 protein [Candidatus Sumerlaeota bacterium]
MSNNILYFIVGHKWMTLGVAALSILAPTSYLLSDFHHPPPKNIYTLPPVQSAPESNTPRATMTEEVYLFTSFRSEGDGLHFADSENGLYWTDLKQVYLAPRVGGQKLRDPYILHGPDGVYHMVWTTSYNDYGIGYANSRDLVNWSEQRFLPVMASVPGTTNCWAPEIYYNQKTSEYVITWSSATSIGSGSGKYDRIYYSTTRDFLNFSSPMILFDAGQETIDATIIEHNGRYYMAHSGPDGIKLAQSFSLVGPYASMNVTVAPSSSRTLLGSTFAKVGDEYILYYIENNSGRCKARKTRDFSSWTDCTNEIQPVSGQTQGVVLKAPRSVVERLVSAAQYN